MVAERVPFTAGAIDNLLSRERLAPAGAGCVSLAWQYRDVLMDGAS